MKKIRVGDINIPAVQYDCILDCISDNTIDTKKYLQNYKPERNKYDGEFNFIFKIKGMHNYFIVVNCFSTSIFTEIIGIFDDFEDENELLIKALGKSSYNIRKAFSMLEKYQNRKVISKRNFMKLFNQLKKGYKKMKQIFEFDYVHIRDILIELQNDKFYQGYYFLKGSKNDKI